MSFTVSSCVWCDQYYDGLVTTSLNIDAKWLEPLCPNEHFKWQGISSVEQKAALVA
jgi:hypothetical protein